MSCSVGRSVRSRRCRIVQLDQHPSQIVDVSRRIGRVGNGGCQGDNRVDRMSGNDFEDCLVRDRRRSSLSDELTMQKIEPGESIVVRFIAIVVTVLVINIIDFVVVPCCG
jgi:hypothetical protein